MLVGRLDESLCAKKSIGRSGRAAKKIESGFAAHSPNAEISNYGVNTLFFVIRPIFRALGSFEPGTSRPLTHPPRAERCSICSITGFFEKRLHSIEIVSPEEKVREFRSVGSVVISVCCSTIFEKVLCRAGFHSRCDPQGAIHIFAVTWVKIHEGFPPLDGFGFHSKLIHDIADPSAVSGSIVALFL